jgi:hypothetical protein
LGIESYQTPDDGDSVSVTVDYWNHLTFLSAPEDSLDIAYYRVVNAERSTYESRHDVFRVEKSDMQKVRAGKIL